MRGIPKAGQGASAMHPMLVKKSDIVIMGAVVGLLFLTMGAWIGQFNARLGSFFVLLTPLLIHCILRASQRAPILTATPQLLVVVEFTAFYWSGLWGIRSGIPYLRLGSTDFSLILTQSLRLSAVTMALIVAMETAVHRGTNAIREDLRTPVGGNRLIAVSQLLIAGSLLGLAGIILNFGGLSQARALLSTHNKLIGAQLAGSLGASLWAILAVPAGITTAALLMRRRDLAIDSRRVIVLAGGLSILLIGSIFIIGERRVPLTIAVGAAGAFYHNYLRPLRARVLMPVSLLGLLISFQIVKARTMNVGASSISLSQLLSYNIFDVSMATLAAPGDLGAKIDSPNRWWQLLTSTLPFIGPSPTEISRYNLDFLIVQQVGTADQARTTGFPPGLPTALLLMTGTVLLAIFLAVILGALLGNVSGRLVSRSGAQATLAYAFLMAFTFEAFKSGDLAATLAAYGKGALYFGFAYIATFFLPFASRRRI
jgi:hypothetical protein